jgi:hypothetical protein
MGTFLIVACVIGSGCLYVMKRNKREDLATQRMELSDVRARLEETRKHVESKRLEVNELRERVNLLESLDREKSAIETQIPAAEIDLASLRKELAKTVRQERSKAAGTMHPEVRLLDGEVLTDVRILSVTDHEISLAHAGGVARVPAKKLPVHFQERFRFGLEMSDQPAEPAPVNPMAASAQVASSRWTDAQRKRVIQLNGSLVAKKAQLLALQQMAARENETALPTNPAASIRTSGLPEEYRIQMDREKQRKAVEINVKNAAIAARARDISTLQKEIAAIQTELGVLYQADQ